MKGQYMKKYRAFTLAEVLIVLAIIAVLAVLVTPMLMNTVPNKEMVMFKKAYATTDRIVNELIHDEDFYPEDPNERLIGFQHTQIGPGMNGTGAREQEASYHGEIVAGDSKFCKLFASKLKLQGERRCRIGRYSLAAGGTFTTTDGIIWSMPFGDFSDNGFTEQIAVDVNGNNPPNCGERFANNQTISKQCEEGEAPDQFTINVARDGRITVNGIARGYVLSQKTNRRYKEVLDDLASGRLR